MTKVKDLYERERYYQKCIFGEYDDLSFLNVASFLCFIEEYVKRAKSAYNGPWKKNSTLWLKGCTELAGNPNAPIETYENLIKIMALSGAALETYTTIDPEQWRLNPLLEGAKWLEAQATKPKGDE